MMARLPFLLFPLLAVPPEARAQAWRTALTVTADLALVVDCGQTLHTLARGGAETNLLLGPRPPAPVVLAYFGAWVGLNTLAPRRLRPWLNGATTLVELIQIARNAR